MTDSFTTRDSKKDDGSMGTVMRGIPQRRVIWVLLVSLITIIGFVGKGFWARLEALESHKAEMNGHLKKMSETLVELKTNVEWIKQRVP